MSRGTILFVEDETGVREVASSVLERMGFEVLSSGDGLDALRIFHCAEDRIDLVVLDMRLPGLDGIELLRELMRGKTPPRVLLTTGEEEPDWGVRSPKLARIGYLQKPYDIQGLQQKVEKMLESQPAMLPTAL